MHKYQITLTNDDDSAQAGPHSVATGRYGFVVVAPSIDDAVRKAVNRAKQEHLYGYDWIASVTPISELGATGAFSAAWAMHIALTDDASAAHLACYQPASVDEALGCVVLDRASPVFAPDWAQAALR